MFLNLNLIDLCFTLLIIIVVFLGLLINSFESILPNFIVQAFRYGKFSYKGNKNAIVNKLEVPKSWFKHFYIISNTGSLTALSLATYVYYFGGVTPAWVIKLFDLCGGNNRELKTSATSTFFALVLFYLQILRRLYETHYVQVFSPKSKINLFHYLTALLHYVWCPIAILLYADGFVNFRSNRYVNNGMGTITVNVILSAVFLFAWINQFRANVILANLRKDKDTGSVVSHKHSIPRGGWFDLVSSPHMLFEVIIYASIAGILHQNTTWWIITAFVISNQTESALLTHWWYQKTFKNYPRKKAIYPYLL